MNRILERLQAGAFSDGAACHAALSTPGAEDDLWGGQCLMLAGQRVAGLTLLLRARQRGCEDAAALLAVARRQEGDAAGAAEVLASVNSSALSVFGRAVADREGGLLHYHAGQVNEALPLMRRAWEASLVDATAHRFVASFTAAYAALLTEVGRDVEAREVLGAVGDVSPSQRAPLLWNQALSAIHTGRFEEADAVLAQVETTALAATAEPLLAYYHGVLARAQGQGHAATRHLTRAAELAVTRVQPETEFYARLALAALSTARDDFVNARGALARAQLLTSGPRMGAFFSLRKGALDLRAGVRGATRRLEESLEAFSALGLVRDHALTHLHLAEAELRACRVRVATSHLRAVLDARHALGNGTLFAVELADLPAVEAYLLSDTRASGLFKVLLMDVRSLEPSWPAVLDVQALGGYGLRHAGKEVVVVGIQRAVELLAYCLIVGPVSLEGMLTDVFGDRPTEQARGYLHVIRHALTRAVPTLDVTYDRQERQYRLYSGTARVRCDAQEVLRATRLGGEFGLARALAWYRGPFLPNTETEWAQAWRQKLIEAVRRLGLDYLELLARKGRFDACLSYAEQLRALNPLDEQVNTLVVEACRACDGKVVARQALRSIISEYRREVGDVPPYLDALALRIGL